MKCSRGVLLVVAFWGCTGEGDKGADSGILDAAEIGSEGAGCYGNGSCNIGLTCASQLCVKLAPPKIDAPIETPTHGSEGKGCYGNGTCDVGLSCASQLCVRLQPEADAAVGQDAATKMDAAVPDAAVTNVDAGEDSGTGGQGGSGPADASVNTKPFGDQVSLDDYPQSMATAACTQLVKCCQNVDDKCVAKRKAVLLSGQKVLKLSISEGKVTFDGKRLAECLNTLTAFSCDANHPNIAMLDCGHIKGQLANGSVCTSSLECKEGYCDKPEGKSVMECIARKPDQQTCFHGGQCLSLFCGRAMSTDPLGKCSAASTIEPGACAEPR